MIIRSLTMFQRVKKNLPDINERFHLLFLAGLLLYSQIDLAGQEPPDYFLYPGITEINRIYISQYTYDSIIIDGNPVEAVWDDVEWMSAQIYTSKNVDWEYITPPEPEGAFSGLDDYSFQFKILWDSTSYYMLFKIYDDVHIYSDHHAGYPGDATIYPFVEEDYGRTLWKDEVRPAVGKGTGYAFDAWRMDHLHFFMTWNNPVFEEEYVRTVDGIMHNFYPWYYLSESPDTGVLVANKYKATPAIYNPTAAYQLNDDNSVYIEFRDTTWSEILPTKNDFGPSGNDTLLINFQINDADGITNRRDYVLFLSTQDGTGSKTTKDWTKLVLHKGATETGTIKQELAPDSFILYPNPNATGTLYLGVEDEVVIYDIFGIYLLSTAQKQQAIDISVLDPGLYIVRNAAGVTKRLIVEAQ